jgi:hypothetical protein
MLVAGPQSPNPLFPANVVFPVMYSTASRILGRDRLRFGFFCSLMAFLNLLIHAKTLGNCVSGDDAIGQRAQVHQPNGQVTAYS